MKERLLKSFHHEMLMGCKLRILLAKVFLLTVAFSGFLCLDVRPVQGAKSGLAAGKVFRAPLRNNRLGPEMVVIPAGTFEMGDADDTGVDFASPVHKVTIPQAFALGKYEVTFEEYDLFCAETGRSYADDESGGRGRKPAIHVSWNDAKAYVEWLSRESGQKYRLPTEAEWEYAARAGTRTSRFWGDSIDQACLYANVADLSAKEFFPSLKVLNCSDGAPFTAEVGRFPSNPFGLHDILGNVWEWCEDTWHSDYLGAPQDGRAWNAVGEENWVRRGGSWFSLPKHVRASTRNGNPTGYRGNETGFRIVRELSVAEITK